MDFGTFFVHVIAGSVGSMIAAAIFRRSNLAFFSKVLAGIVGGGMGGQILSATFNLPMIGTGSLSAVTMLAHIASASLGGALALVIIGLLRSRTSQ